MKSYIAVAPLSINFSSTALKGQEMISCLPLPPPHVCPGSSQYFFCTPSSARNLIFLKYFKCESIYRDLSNPAFSPADLQVFIYCLFKSFVSQSNFFTGKLESLLFNSQGRVVIELAMRELTSLEKKEEIKLAKKLKNKTHFNLKDILRLMEHHRQHCEVLDEMEKTEFINLLNNNFKFDDKILLERIYQVFNISRVKIIG